MIWESQWKLNQLLPQENLEPFVVTVNQEIAFIDVKLEPENEYEVSRFPVNPDSEEAPISKANKNQKSRNETKPRKSRSAINRSCNKNSPEPEENSLKKRGRPKKSAISQTKPVTDEDLFKIEFKECSRKSSPDLSSRFSDIPNHDSSDDDFKLPKTDLDQIISENKKPKKTEIFTTCNICPKVKKVCLQDKDDFKIHNEYVHEDLKNPFLGPYKCKTCSKVITSEVKMRKHVRLFHVFGNEKLCTTCGKKFYDRRAFYCHIDKNHGIRVRK